MAFCSCWLLILLWLAWGILISKAQSGNLAVTTAREPANFPPNPAGSWLAIPESWAQNLERKKYFLFSRSERILVVLWP